ncbi:MAG: T9SS type A sorting domain-containing protein, partial [Bacteroidota bacterium]|nr:T9SS type A sorting domain-containing protein [Bacteroidota bacterium]
LDLTTGGGAEDNFDHLSVRPNPFADGTLINFNSAPETDMLIELLDVQGRIVRSLTVSVSQEDYLERGDLDAGIYLLRMHQGDRNFIGRVIAQ